MANLNLYSCAIELTRRCNMTCEHCLRGDAQNLDLQPDILNTFLDRISGINCLTLTGGEPTLAVPQMKMVLDGLKKRNIPVENYYVVTNGYRPLHVPDRRRRILRMDRHCIRHRRTVETDSYQTITKKKPRANMPSAFLFFKFMFIRQMHQIPSQPDTSHLF